MEVKNKKQVIIWVVVLIIAAGLIGFLYLQQKPGASPPPTESVSTAEPSPGFSSDVPADAIPSEPLETITLSPASPKEKGIVQKIFDLKAEGGAYQPAQIVMRVGDNVYITFRAIDRDYDLAIAAPIGIYLQAKKGETKPFGFIAPLKGVYTFTCKEMCPPGEEMKGELIVLDKEEL